MTNDIAIDTSSLLTILGVIAAVWAIIPANNRLRFRLSVTWLDWLIVIVVFLIAHYLVFKRALDAVGLYYSFGPWKWGLDKGSAVYLLLLALGFYLLARARSPKLARQNVGTFGKLVDNLLLTKRYDELVSLVEPQLSKLLKLSQHRPLLARVAAKFAPKPVFNFEVLLHGEPVRRDLKAKHYDRSRLSQFETFLLKRDHASRHANEILQSISNDPALVAHLAVTHPYLCLSLLERPQAMREDLIELFMDALLADHTSRIYVELKNNQNQKGRHRLALPESNRILCFFFKDVSVAAKLGLYRAIGESVCRTLDEDQRLAEAYNSPLGYYNEVGKYRCPVHAGIKLFEIMVHEGIHQGQQDHLWLFYFTHFTTRILKQMREASPDDEYHEWPTPFYYLLYEIVRIASNWVEDCVEIKTQDIPESTREQKDFDLFYISRQATIALGSIVQDIVQSSKVADGFKDYVLEIVLRRYKHIERDPQTMQVANDLVRSLTVGADFPTKIEYRYALQRGFDRLDHVLPREVPKFASAIKMSLQDSAA
ncbi:hypothetical protein [Thiobacillus sp.]|uniref:hypothetical protein n=1 Tax=Thiobacillus sp. TaxID=924 RepID=UPI0025DF346E|nr:hypothetical protein [Thiobacillus sp.]